MGSVRRRTASGCGGRSVAELAGPAEAKGGANERLATELGQTDDASPPIPAGATSHDGCTGLEKGEGHQ